MFELNATCLIFIVMFIAFMLILNNQVLKPIGAAMQKRQELIKADIQAGSAARATAGETVADYERKLQATRAQAQATVNEALAQAQQVRQLQMNKVHQEGQEKLNAAKSAIAQERTALLDQLVEEERALVSTIIKKLLGDQAAAFANVDATTAKRALEEAS